MINNLTAFLSAVEKFGGIINASNGVLSPYIRNVVFPGVDAEAAMVFLKDQIAVSNGSACTSTSYTSSHVLNAMGLDEDQIQSSIRFSFSHLSKEYDWSNLFQSLNGIRL